MSRLKVGDIVHTSNRGLMGAMSPVRVHVQIDKVLSKDGYSAKYTNSELGCVLVDTNQSIEKCQCTPEERAKGW